MPLHERMPEEEKAAFVAELKAFIKARPPGTAARLCRLAGLGDQTVANTISRESASAPTAEKLRAAMKQLEADPSAGWVPKGQAARRAKKRVAAEPKTPKERLGWKTRAAEQADLRERARVFCKGVPGRDAARQLGLSHSTLTKFLAGGAIRKKTLAAVTAHFHGPKSERAAGIVKASPVQVGLPGIAPPTNGSRVQLLTARLDAAKVPSAPAGEAVIVEQFIRKIGIEALEALLQLAKARQEGDHHG